MRGNPYGRIRYEVKSCGQRHAFCKKCRPDIKTGAKKGVSTPSYKHKGTSKLVTMKKTLWIKDRAEIFKHEESIRKIRLLKKTKREKRLMGIKELHKKGYSLREIGKQYDLSGERVRQLLLNK